MLRPAIAFHDAEGRPPRRGRRRARRRRRSACCEGRIVAVKGIGGYHLAADATNADAVAELRRRKARDDKPFALMVADLEMARSLCVLDADAEAALARIAGDRSSSPRAGRAPSSPTASRPGMADLGLMLAYTPLHHLLMAKVARPLVMTSGNRSDDPIAHDDDDAFARLGALVDGVLAHDRPIHIRCDDSVVRATGRRLQMVRRSRGYAPEAVAARREAAQRQVLAVGAELKNTVSVAKESLLVCSHHIGDLEHLAAYQAFLQATVHLCRLFGIDPEVVAHDLHPEYLSTKHALELDIEPWPVQHHHAHIASCLVEHRHTGTVLGIAFDGLGYGTDGTMWGGEFLVADFDGFERVGAPAAGRRCRAGRRPIREPWRMALRLDGARRRPRSGRPTRARRSILAGARSSPSPSPASRGGQRAVLTTSAGRLFDAVAALVGLPLPDHLRGPGRHRARDARAVASPARRPRGTRRRSSSTAARRGPPAASTCSTRRRSSQRC